MKISFVGVSPSIQKIRKTIELISADTALNVLITGETGVGKEVVAQALHMASPRESNKFVKVNCAAIPETLLESELFGVEAGAYTGANKLRQGKVGVADGGVLFLDEIGDMDFHLQAKLLHVLQNGEYNRLGSETNIKSDIWIISATNQGLRKKIQGGTFREDLYYRLNQIKIDIPPLRERPEDIPELISYYTQKCRRDYPSRAINTIDAATMDRLRNFSWPGNVRQLISVLQRILLINCDSEILDELLDEPCDIESPNGKPSISSNMMDSIKKITQNMPDDLTAFPLKQIKRDATDIVEREVISQVLTKTNWNRSNASKILQISYKTLLTKICQLNIVRPT